MASWSGQLVWAVTHIDHSGSCRTTECTGVFSSKSDALECARFERLKQREQFAKELDEFDNEVAVNLHELTESSELADPRMLIAYISSRSGSAVVCIRSLAGTNLMELDSLSEEATVSELEAELVNKLMPDWEGNVTFFCNNGDVVNNSDLLNKYSALSIRAARPMQQIRLAVEAAFCHDYDGYPYHGWIVSPHFVDDPGHQDAGKLWVVTHTSKSDPGAFSGCRTCQTSCSGVFGSEDRALSFARKARLEQEPDFKEMIAGEVYSWGDREGEALLVHTEDLLDPTKTIVSMEIFRYQDVNDETHESPSQTWYSSPHDLQHTYKVDKDAIECYENCAADCEETMKRKYEEAFSSEPNSA